MGTDRINAFSDGVIAILITIMVLELRVPHTTDISALRELLPVFLTYVLSFIVIGVYWNNHHHMLSLTDRITGGILWANLHLLFWLSLMPFVTGWMGENHFAALPTALYGVVLFFAGVAYYVLEQTIISSQGRKSRLRDAVGSDFKGKISVVIYLAAIPLAFVSQLISDALYVSVTLMWLIPDRRIEERFGGTVDDEERML
ncbi:MAG: TMEM175 family protein [Gemmatimonadaceae bacterium]